MNKEDEILITQIKKGDKKAFDKLVLKYQYRLIKIMHRYTHDLNEVYDLVQETFIRVFNHLDKFRGESAFYSWLYRIAINTAKNHLAHADRRPICINIDLKEAEDYLSCASLKELNSPEHYLLCEEIKTCMNQAIENLPKALRLALLLREQENYSYDEIATKIACPVGTVRSRIFRARFMLNEAVKNLL